MPWKRPQPSLALLARSSKPQALSCQDLSVPSLMRTDSHWAAGHHMGPQHPGEHICARGPAGGSCPSPPSTPGCLLPGEAGVGMHPCAHRVPLAGSGLLLGRVQGVSVSLPVPCKWSPAGSSGFGLQQSGHWCCSPPWNGFYKQRALPDAEYYIRSMHHFSNFAHVLSTELF